MSLCLNCGSLRIEGLSDLDMIYSVPANLRAKYTGPEGAAKLLDDTKEALVERYPNTDIKRSRCVVSIKFSDNLNFDVMPAFEQTADDGVIEYLYPDTYDGGGWKVTKPRHEQLEFKYKNDEYQDNLRRLCKMLRSWKKTCEVEMGGLLIDTLAYNFITANECYREFTYGNYPQLMYDFFEFLSKEPEQSYYLAPGSRQRVKVHHSFKARAQAAFKLCQEIEDCQNDEQRCKKYRELFGKAFPNTVTAQLKLESLPLRYDDTEQFIEQRYPTAPWVRQLNISCSVKARGRYLGEILQLTGAGRRLGHNLELNFSLQSELSSGDKILWKVKNGGIEAMRRNMIRGELCQEGARSITEHTQFKGNHYVECYQIRNGMLIGRGRVQVPIG